MSDTYATSAAPPGSARDNRDKQTQRGPAQARYEALRVNREPYLVRARRLSRLTVPALFREYGETGASSEIMPWQTLGAYCVNNLAAKLTLALFPPGIPFIKLKQTKAALMGLSAITDPDARGKLKAEIDKGLSAVEVEFVEGCEEDGDRFRLFDGILHYLVGGTHGFHVQNNGRLKSIALDNFVCLRDNSGNLIEAVVEDPMAWETVPDDVREAAISGGYEEGRNQDPPSTQNAPLCVYTHILRLKGGKQYRVYQEVMGARVKGSEYVWDEDALPYIFAPLKLLKKESYGRSFAEDYEGDLQGLDGGWQIIMEAGAAIARLVYLVKPGGVTNKQILARAGNGDVITGDVEDVAAFRAEKGADLDVLIQTIERLEGRLSKIFLLYSSVQRDGERVTAEEIATLRKDLEAALGGVYSNQVITLQTPYARAKMNVLQRDGRVTKLPKGATKMTILTGDAGLGRAKIAQDTDELIGTANQVLGQEVVAPYISIGNYLARASANRSIDPDGLFKSDDQVSEEQRQQQLTATMSAAAPEAVKQMGGMMQQSQAAALAGQAAPAPTDQAAAAPAPAPQ